jgi:ATP/maltotriose-dependent transcriptional regulator MalT/DNA-binding SARP family transcriptional activator
VSVWEEPAPYFAKVVPPLPRGIGRPRQAARLATAVSRRLTALIAGPGCGKTTLLAGWAAGHHCAWYGVTAVDRDPLTFARGLVASLSLRVPGLPDDLGPALAGMRGPDTHGDDLLAAFSPALAAALHARLTSDLVLIIDDLQELDQVPAAERCVAELCQLAPPRLHLVLASRGALPFTTERMFQEGQLLRLTADGLAFDRAETAALLADAGVGPELAGGVVALTGGWPAAVALLSEALAAADDPAAVLDRFADSGGPFELVGALLEREVMPRAPAGLTDLLLVGAAVDSFTVDLLADLGVPDAARTLDAARHRGSVVTAAASDGWFALTPMVREYVRSREHLLAEPRHTAGLPPGEHTARLRRGAAAWHEARGDVATALRYLTLAGDGATIARLLERYGSRLLAAGHSATVLEAVDAVPPAARTAALDLVEGEACQVRGDWDRAVTCLARLIPGDPVAAADPAPAAAAWRLGLIHHLRGELEPALALYRRGLADAAGADRDRALCAAWGAAAAWLTGDVALTGSLLEAAQPYADAAGDHGAFAAVHTAQALLAALAGDRRANDLHYLRALDHAQRAGDVLAQIRIRVNRGSRFLEEGFYGEAAVELDTAVRLADLAGFAALRALALVNRGETARWRGRLEDAGRDFTEALRQARRIGSRIAGYALCGLGHVHADQGNPTQARVHFTQAIALAEPTGDLQGVVPAWSGLAVLLADDDPGMAATLAVRALRSDATLARAGALLAAGWVAVRRGDAAEAGRCADEAGKVARERRDRAAVAEAVELRAHAEADDDEAASGLRQAESLWRELDCPVPLARTRLALARRVGGREAARICDEVERECRDLGARRLVAVAVTVRAELARGAQPGIAIQTLGGFRVLRRGEAVTPAEWPSPQAELLLKRLVAAPGHRLDNGELGALSADTPGVRVTLDPDHRHPDDQYLVIEAGGVRLRADRVQLDVAAFLARAAAALADATAVELDALSAAEAAYTGDFCPEDPDAAWAVELRERARGAYVALTRTLAQRHTAAGAHDTAVRYLLRLLSCDPYDAQAHLDLVRELDVAGRYGDSRRTYRDYAGRMDELGAEPEPYPIAPG